MRFFGKCIHENVRTFELDHFQNELGNFQVELGSFQNELEKFLKWVRLSFAESEHFVEPVRTYASYILNL